MSLASRSVQSPARRMTRQYRPGPSLPVVATAKECHSCPSRLTRTNSPSERRPGSATTTTSLVTARNSAGRRRTPRQGCATSMTSTATSNTDGWWSSPARDEPGGSDRSASAGTVTARIPSAAQPPSRWTDSKRLCRDCRTRSLAVRAMTTRIASTLTDAIRATGEDGTATRDSDCEPGHARDRRRTVQLPQVIGQLVQPVRRHQPPQHENSPHDSVVARGHRDTECREGPVHGPAADPAMAR